MRISDWSSDVCSSDLTGVAGLTLSGGIGWLRARHGLSVDNLVAADVVTADGGLVRASDDENPDLLWALKGGGGNFGVVVRFEFALHPIGPEVMFAAPIYALDDGPAPIRAWRDFLAKHGDRDRKSTRLNYSHK